MKTKNSTENFQFLQLQKNLYITWACFRNAYVCTNGLFFFNLVTVAIKIKDIFKFVT